MPTHISFASLCVLGYAAWAMAQAPHTLPAELAAPGTPVLIPREGGGTNVRLSEGAAADWQGNVYYNEMLPTPRTMQVKVGDSVAAAWRPDNDAPNGIWLDTQNRLVICQARAIVRVKAGAAFDNQTDTLYKYAIAQDFNDVTGDSKDNLYFTNHKGRSVFFRDAATGTTREVLSGRPNPNGVEWDEERKIVYVCESSGGKVAAYTVGADFSLTGRRDFASVPSADGIVLDELGNVYTVTYGTAVHVFSPNGTKLGLIPLSGSQMTNIAFGGADFKTLFMVTDRGIHKLPMKVKGYKTGQPVTVSIGKGMAAGQAIMAPKASGKAVYRADGRRKGVPETGRPDRLDFGLRVR
jgi:sugar lactone lactonase YvrE